MPTPRLLLALAVFFCLPAAPAEVDFNEDVRPIISDRCFHCHGPDAENQKSDFRVDNLLNATADLGGYAGIVPGDPKASELIARIHTEDGDDLMPPPDSNRSLTDQQKAILDQWIKEGAVYDKHWSFKQVVRPAVPELTENANWCINPIDNFISHFLPISF